MADENLNQPNADSNLGDSNQQAVDSTEYLKPWIKTLGKSFAQNKELGGYDSLSDCVNDLLKRPKAKDVPETYEGADDELSGILKKANITKEEAKAIDGYYQKKIPKDADLKEVFGTNYDKTMASFEKGKSILKDIATDAEKTGADKNPTFIRLMALVGDQSKGTTFVPPKDTSTGQSSMEKLIRATYGFK